MPYRISRLGTVEIRSLDLDRDLDYYLNVLGLQLTAREGRTAYLKGWDERHAYSLVLTEADRAGMVRLAFRTVDPEDLDYYEKRLRQFSVKYDVIPEEYRRGRALRFTVPSGHVVELYNEMDYTGNLLPTVNPAPWPEGLKGIAPPRRSRSQAIPGARESHPVLSRGPGVPRERDARESRGSHRGGMALATAGTA